MHLIRAAVFVILVINKPDIVVDLVGIYLLVLLKLMVLVHHLELIWLAAQRMGYHILLHFEGLFLL